LTASSFTIKSERERLVCTAVYKLYLAVLTNLSHCLCHALIPGNNFDGKGKF